MKILLLQYSTTENWKEKIGKGKKAVNVVNSTDTTLFIDITNLVSSFTWTGSDSQASRYFEFEMINAPLYPNMNVIIPEIFMGNWLTWYGDDEQIIFHGMVYEKESKATTGTEAFVARDLIYNLMKSKVTRKFNGKAENIAASICKEVGIDAGNLDSTRSKIKVLAQDNTYYEVIRDAYEAGSQGLWKYKILMNGTKLNVIKKGAVVDLVDLSDMTNITEASIIESISDVINSVTAYSQKGKAKGTVTNEDSIKKYGTFIGAYTVEKGVNWKDGAKNQLVGESQEISVECLGQMSCISGYAVKVKDSATGLDATYWITSDSHKFENGIHTMSLTLSFNSITA